MAHYDLAVIGSGSGNSLIDENFADWNVALIEKDPVFGGTCLNRGCIPTKMFVLPADHAASVTDAQRLGVDLKLKGADWPAIRDRIFGRIDPLSEGGKAWRQNSENVTLYSQAASFVDPHTLAVGEQQITADKIVIATGSRPRELDVAVPEELADRIFTSDNIMRIDKLPQRLVILGGGFVAAEFAHIFSSFGVEVVVIQRSDKVLRHFDDDIADAYTQSLRSKVKLRLNQRVSAVETGPAGDVQVVCTDAVGVEYLYVTDAVLVATGRIRNSDLLNLTAAGVSVGAHGQIQVDAQQRTSQPHIWALGDVSSDYLLKHVANAEARTVHHNLLHPDNPVTTDHRYVPSAVFGNPEVATVGVTEQQLREWGTPYVVARQSFADVAYGWAMEAEEGFVKLLADPRSGRLLGAHILGPQAPTLIQPLIQAMSFGLSVGDMARGQYWIHPALPEVVENALLQLKDAQPA